MKVTSFLPSVLAAAGIAITSSFLVPSSAQAFGISFGSTSQSSNNPATGASAFVDFSFIQEGNNVRLGLDITNTTGQSIFGAGATQSKLTGVAFDLLEGLSVVSNSYIGSSFFPTLLQNVNFTPFSNQVGDFSVGVADNGNFEGGNANGALPQGGNTFVSFLLSGTNLVAATLESQFLAGFQNNTLQAAVRFQQVNAGAGSDKLLGGTIVGGTTGGGTTGGDTTGGDTTGGDTTGGDTTGGDTTGGDTTGGDTTGGDNGGGDTTGGDTTGGDTTGGDTTGGDTTGGDTTGGDNGGSTKVPEPGTVAALALMVGGLRVVRRRKSN
ncbi:PEP-CTERM sorting domain-containing protein [Trichocoleus sp. DQ-U1]|uniref:PEP-CTERM sorting domain-containing protein n=1 Tax=Trichocoleus sp. DQ-U1 TaxID=2933926 RepID=UPI003299B738